VVLMLAASSQLLHIHDELDRLLRVVHFHDQFTVPLVMQVQRWSSSDARPDH
jgi:hypothetical protein